MGFNSAFKVLIVLTGKMSSAAMKGPSHHKNNCAETFFAALLGGHFRNHNMNQHLKDSWMTTITVNT
jgi:hypothetical protein